MSVWMREAKEETYMCLRCQTAPTIRKAHGVRIQLELELTPAGKKRRSNICHCNGFKHIGMCVFALH